MTGFYGWLISCKAVVDDCTPESQFQSGNAKQDGFRKPPLHSVYYSKAIFEEGNMPSMSQESPIDEMRELFDHDELYRSYRPYLTDRLHLGGRYL